MWLSNTLDNLCHLDECKRGVLLFPWAEMPTISQNEFQWFMAQCTKMGVTHLDRMTTAKRVDTSPLELGSTNTRCDRDDWRRIRKIRLLLFVFEHLYHRIHDDVIKWKHFPRYRPFVRGIHRSPVNSAHKGQWPDALFSLICAWLNGWVNNREAGD